MAAEFELPCLGPPGPTSGCTDETACNYDANAEEDDGSCAFPGDACGDGVGGGGGGGGGSDESTGVKQSKFVKCL